MFPFHRKHGNSPNSAKQPGKRRLNIKENVDDGEMSDEEYLEYLRNNDNSRHQLTSGAHDRYCHQILREKEGILLSALNSVDDSPSPISNSVRLGPSNNNIFKCLLSKNDENVNKYRESISMPSSPVENKDRLLSTESIARRKSDTISETSVTNRVSDACSCSQEIDDEYILTLKIDNLASDMEDISFYRIGPKHDVEVYENDYYPFRENLEKYELTESATDLSQLSDNSPSPVKTYNYSSVKHYEIDIETSIGLKRLLIGSENKHFSNQWLRQCFSFCHISASRWRLVQIKAGCCGVIAAVEAFLIKALLFEPGYCKFKEPLRPSQKEVVDGFIHALSYILWQAGSFKKAIVITPSTFDITKTEDSSYLKDGITDSFVYAEYFDFEQLKDAVAANMRFFTNSPNHGYLNFLICVILSRGIYRTQEDMDDDAVSLITENGHCSMELVMLLITGHAVSNVFDNDIQIDSCLLKGVKQQSDIGLLSLFEHLNTCEIGNYLKSPKFPVWLVNYTDHFTVLFSSKLEHAQQSIEQPFVLYHYDSMTAFSCENDIKLVIDPLTNFSDDQLEKDQTHLQLCIRTKWKNAIVIYAENSELFLV